MAPLQELFPEKGKFGSLINSFEPVVTDRIHSLQRYLQSLLSLEGVLTLPVVQTFFDVNGKGFLTSLFFSSLFFSLTNNILGVSGFRKAIGSTNILKETYLEFSWATFEFMSLFLWSTNYVGLTKRGYLYVFSTLYDELSDALVTIDLRTIDVRISGDVSTRVIGISNPSTKIFLKFSTVDEFSGWLRQVSDFGVNAASQNTPSRAVDKLQSNTTNASTTTSRKGRIAQSNTGKNETKQNDEFSDMFGM